MKCPFCNANDDRVVDSRESAHGEVIRRRRECLGCQRRFTSYERIEEVPAMVIKKDGRRELFDPQKLLAGLLKACEKRAVPRRSLESLVADISALVQEASDRELATEVIGQKVAEGLRRLDQVAYVRFASVYREFQDVEEFLDEIRGLVGRGKGREREEP
ncbi:MAG: transcriptional regulator NrdR [Acidobacteriota bacterium]|nr:transcriptional regulator NrdR [Acidobacteriota bacterium]MDQ7088529.1 transcriptional regulator NrdR [Acidobacteriota bacterium]